MNETGNDTKATGKDNAPVEPFYIVGEPDKKLCRCGCYTPVFTADMIENGEDIPLFHVETEYKAQLAAQLLGCSLRELNAAMKLYKEYVGFKKNGIASIGFTDKSGEERI